MLLLLLQLLLIILLRVGVSEDRNDQDGIIEVFVNWDLIERIWINEEGEKDQGKEDNKIKIGEY